MKRDIVIIGAGPAGIFTALELIKKGSKRQITIVEKGSPIEKRACPKSKTQKCVSCKPYCHITTGFSGAGAFSDGKLSLCAEVGGDLPNVVGYDVVEDTIKYTDSIYLEFGADEHIEGISNPEEATHGTEANGSDNVEGDASDTGNGTMGDDVNGTDSTTGNRNTQTDAPRHRKAVPFGK